MMMDLCYILISSSNSHIQRHITWLPLLLLFAPAMPLASLFGSHPCERHGLPECVLARADVQDGKTVSWQKVFIIPVLKNHGETMVQHRKFLNMPCGCFGLKISKPRSFIDIYKDKMVV